MMDPLPDNTPLARWISGKPIETGWKALTGFPITGTTSQARKNPLVARTAGPVLLIFVFFCMVLQSWRKWPDILIDFGRELYLPWQITSGKVLYRDMAHLFGPFSSYFNALMFSIFGTSYSVIFRINLLLLALFLILLYRFLSRVTSRIAAFTSCLVILSGFAFSQYVMIANANFISPFSHEATHGIILSSLLIFSIRLYTLSQRLIHIALAGVLFGLVFLTKVEISLALFVAVSCYFGFLARYPDRGRYRSLIIFTVSALLPVAGFLAYFSTVMPFRDAIKAVCGSWSVLMNRGVTDNPFYRKVMGIDDFTGNLTILAIHSLTAILTIWSGLRLSRLRSGNRSSRLINGLCAVYFTGIVTSAFLLDPTKIARSLPVLMILSVAVLARSLRSSPDEDQRYRLVPLLLWALFSTALLLKIILYCRIQQYGFYLTLPAAVVICCMLVWFLPAWLERNGISGSLFRNTFLLFLIILSVRMMLITNRIQDLKTYPVSEGADRIMTFNPGFDARGPIVAAALGYLRSNLGELGSFVVVPEGVMLNFLTRHSNPTLYTNFMLPELEAFGEPAIVKNLSDHPPDVVVLVHKDTSEYGLGFFGIDPRNGKMIMDWVRTNYHSAALFGREPFTGSQFGIQVLERNEGITDRSSVGHNKR